MSGATHEMSVQDSFRLRLRRRPPLLYAIVDQTAEDDPAALALARELLRGGADCLQIRAKKISPRGMEAFVRELLPDAHAAAVPLLVNDRVDVALSAGAHGAHLGQDDMPAREARRLLGDVAILGFSTHSLEELQAAQNQPVDYLGFGAVFPTNSREDSHVAGPQALTPAGAATTLPLIAIGGITPERLAQLPLDSVSGVAAISAFLPAERTTDVLRRFRDSLRGT